MTDQARLRRDALRVYQGDGNIQHQESLTEQLDDLLTLAVMFGLYDAADFLRPHIPTSTCYSTPIPNHDYSIKVADTEHGSVYECSRCHRRIIIEVVPFESQRERPTP